MKVVPSEVVVDDEVICQQAAKVILAGGEMVIENLGNYLETRK